MERIWIPIKTEAPPWTPTHFSTRLRLLTGRDLLLTPLVDVVFLLLIFFMMGSSLVFQPGTPVNLPETAKEFIGVADKLVITITKEGLLFFNDQHMEDWGALQQAIANIGYRRSNDGTGTGKSGNRGRVPIIILKADREVSYNDIVRVMSMTRQYGMSIFLATKTTSP